jgi:hypothetical protein
MRLEALALATPETTTSLIGALIRRFAGDFGGTLALIGAFRAFGTVKTFFFSIGLIDFAYAVDNFFCNGINLLEILYQLTCSCSSFLLFPFFRLFKSIRSS